MAPRTREFSNGILGRMASYISTERERRRKAEDDELDYQQSLVKGLLDRPDFNPAHIGQALQDMYNLQKGKTSQRKRAGGREGFMGGSELPISQLLTGIYNKERPMMGPTSRMQTVQGPGFETQADEPLNPAQIPGWTQPGMVQPGNIDLRNQPRTRNVDGSSSSVRSLSFGQDGAETLIPTVAHDGSGILSNDDAISQYDRSGKHLGRFASVPEATGYAGRLHDSYAAGDLEPLDDRSIPNMDAGSATEAPIADMLGGKEEDFSKHPTQRARERFAADPAAMAFRQGFTGQSVLNTPVMVPPPPIEAMPTGNRMMGAARAMQTDQMLPVPPTQQPILRDPMEMAQQVGQAEGIKQTATAKGKRQGDLQALTEMFGKEQALEILKRQVMGASGAAPFRQDTTPTIYQSPDGGQKMAIAMRIDQSTGETIPIDVATGQRAAIPAGWTAVGSGASAGQDPTSKKEYDIYAAEEAKAGRTPIPFDDWLTRDANRKKSTVNINNQPLPNSTLNPRQAGIFNGIVAKYQTSPLMKAADRLPTLLTSIRSVYRNPADAASQLALSYAFVQALDTYQSAVREGELKNLTMIDSKVGQLQQWAQQMTSGMIVRPEIAKQIADAANMIAGSIQGAMATKAKEFEAQAYINGLDSEWAAWRARSAGQAPAAASPAAPGVTNGSGPQIGDKKVTPNGMTLYFDGQGWTDEPVIPEPPRVP